MKHTDSNLQDGGIHHSSCLEASLLGSTCMRPTSRPAPLRPKTSGVTLGEAPVTADGTWTPKAPYTPSYSGNTVTVPVPAASAVLLTVR